MKTRTPKSKRARNSNGGSRCVQRSFRHLVVEAYDKYREANPQVFDCTTLNMHPAHHRYLANLIQDAFESGWNAARMPNSPNQRQAG